MTALPSRRLLRRLLFAWAAAALVAAVLLLAVFFALARSRQGFFTVPGRTVLAYTAGHLFWLLATSLAAGLPALLILLVGGGRVPGRLLRSLAVTVAAYLLLRWTGRHFLLPEDAFLRYGLPEPAHLSPAANTLGALAAGLAAALLPSSSWRCLRILALPAGLVLLVAGGVAVWDRLAPDFFHPGRRPPTVLDQVARYGEATLRDLTRPVLPPAGENPRRVPLRTRAGGGQVSGAFALLPEAAGEHPEAEVQARVLAGDRELWSWQGTAAAAAREWHEYRLPVPGEGVLELALEVSGVPPEAALWARPGVGAPRAGEEWNLLLVSLDTLRPDRLGCYGGPRPTSPHIDALAREGVLFEHAYANAPWTRPSQMTILTGLMPSAHGLEMPLGEGNPHLDPKEVETLAAILARRGFLTAAFTGSSAISARFGYASGFHRYLEVPMVHLREDPPEHLAQIVERSAQVPDDTILDVDVVTREAMEWLDAHGQERFFLFFHTYEIHHPYTHTVFLGEAGDEPRARRLARYDSGIRVTDEWLGRLLGHMAAAGILDRTLVVVTSDHGEDLGEHDDSLLHGHHQYNVLLHVPLILRAPGLLPAGRRIGAPVQHLDLLPTVLALLGVPAPPAAPGRDLSPAWTGGTLPPAWILAEANNFGPEIFAIQDGHRKAWRIPSPERIPPGPRPAVPLPGLALFDLDSDPGETHNLAPAVAPPLEMQRALDIWIQEAARLRAAHAAQRRQDGGLLGLGPEQEARLRELGYLGD